VLLTAKREEKEGRKEGMQGGRKEKDGRKQVRKE
jgi:hypothetical protein